MRAIGNFFVYSADKLAATYDAKFEAVLVPTGDFYFSFNRISSVSKLRSAARDLGMGISSCIFLTISFSSPSVSNTFSTFRFIRFCSIVVTYLGFTVRIGEPGYGDVETSLSFLLVRDRLPLGCATLALES